jgi:hypothetical protein
MGGMLQGIDTEFKREEKWACFMAESVYDL